MNLKKILEKLSQLNNIPNKRIKKDIILLDNNILNKIENIIIDKNKDSLYIKLNTKPYNIILYIPPYYPFKPITCQVIFIPHHKNRLISKILLKKLPNDLLLYPSINYDGIWQFIDNSVKIDGKKFLYMKNKNDLELVEKITLNYDNIYNNWYPNRGLNAIIKEYLLSLSPYIYL